MRVHIFAKAFLYITKVKPKKMLKKQKKLFFCLYNKKLLYICLINNK